MRSIIFPSLSPPSLSLFSLLPHFIFLHWQILLSSQITTLRTALEQERTKNKALRTELTKLQVCVHVSKCIVVVINTTYLWIDAALNSSCTIWSSEWNQRCPRIVAVASKRGTRTHEWMISDDCHHASARTVCVVRVISTADSRTERLRVLLTASSNHHRLTRTYLIQPSLMSPDFPKK